MNNMKTIKELLVAVIILTSLGPGLAQDVHIRNNGAAQNSVTIIRSDNAAGDQNQNQTSDLDFQIWDSNTRLNIPQGRIGMVGHGTATQALEASGRMAFYTTNQAYPSPTLTERMRIDENGNVGIGTMAPTSRLNIYNSGNGTTLHIGNPNSGSGGFTSLTMGTSSDSGGYSWIQSVKSSGSAYGSIILNASGGYVGIGTSAPDSKLSVNGTIHSKEVKVDLTGWPDYVFDEAYDLQPLNEVKNFIKQNKRLPEMPSAKEVEENGVLLGEMNKLLLKKLEEVTLHLIRQQEEIDELKKELSKK